MKAHSTQEQAREQAREAAVWITLLHSPDRSAKVDRGFRRWLAAHPGNTKAFEAASRGWEAAGTLPKGPFPHHLAAQPASVGHRFGAALAAAAVLVLAVGGVLLYGHSAGVTTEIGEQRIVTLEDGTRVFLNTDTRVVVRYDRRRRAVELKSGEAYFDVAKRGPERPFVVMAGGRQVSAVGTAFMVRREADWLRVTLIEGRVTVSSTALNAGTSETERVVELNPGQRLTLTEAGPPALDEPSLEKVTAWRTGYLDLPVMPLSEAVAEMNRYSRNRIRIAEPDSGDIPVSGVFRAGDNVSFAQAVAESYGLEAVMEGEGIVLKK